MSSLFGALTVAVGGLTAQSDAIGDISDNLSNAQTTGFKSIGTDFLSLVTDSSATVNDPGGVTSIPQYQNDVQGNLVQSGTATSLAITGQGFFPVETATVDANGNTDFTGNDLYTRQGDFTLNKDGYLVNGSGYYLLGWSVDPTTGVADTSTTNPIQLSALLDNPVATSSANYQANLPANATAGAFTSAPSTIQVFDALGTTHDMSLTWVKTGTNTWILNVDVANGVSSVSDYTATVPFTFNSTSQCRHDFQHRIGHRLYADRGGNRRSGGDNLCRQLPRHRRAEHNGEFRRLRFRHRRDAVRGFVRSGFRQLLPAEWFAARFFQQSWHRSKWFRDDQLQ